MQTLAESGFDLSKATVEATAQLLAENRAKEAEIVARYGPAKGRLATLLETAKRNRASMVANSKAIMERREKILANRKKIAANQAAVAGYISKI